MRIEVYRPNQELPAHRISEDLAHKICGEKLAKWLNPQAILLRTSEALGDIKKRFQPKYIPILAVRDWRECLILVYPHRSQETQFCRA